MLNANKTNQEFSQSIRGRSEKIRHQRKPLLEAWCVNWDQKEEKVPVCNNKDMYPWQWGQLVPRPFHMVNSDRAEGQHQDPWNPDTVSKGTHCGIALGLRSSTNWENALLSRVCYAPSPQLHREKWPCHRGIPGSILLIKTNLQRDN